MKTVYIGTRFECEHLLTVLTIWFETVKFTTQEYRGDCYIKAETNANPNILEYLDACTGAFRQGMICARSNE